MSSARARSQKQPSHAFPMSDVIFDGEFSSRVSLLRALFGGGASGRCFASVAPRVTFEAEASAASAAITCRRVLSFARSVMVARMLSSLYRTWVEAGPETRKAV